MSETMCYADNFSRSFGEQQECLQFLREREENASWRSIPTKEVRFEAIDESSTSGKVLCDWYRLMGKESILQDTMANTKLLLRAEDTLYPVRSCALSTILSRARISGHALSKVSKPVLAQILNHCVSVASGNALLRLSDERVRGSEIGPVVYFRDGSGDSLTSCSSLALRWGVSKTTASRILARLDRLGYLNVLTFSGRHGTVIYLENYLSVMFQISDLPIHKEDVALQLQLKTASPAEKSCVPSEKISVSKRIMLELLPKLLQSLAVWGFFCCSCKKKSVKLYPLSPACNRWKLEVSCKSRTASVENSSRYCFEIRVTEGSG